ncbi:MAG: hypothetical protein QXQ53_04705 [Candidatus Methanosuratincola sp.]
MGLVLAIWYAEDVLSRLTKKTVKAITTSYKGFQIQILPLSYYGLDEEYGYAFEVKDLLSDGIYYSSFSDATTKFIAETVDEAKERALRMVDALSKEREDPYYRQSEEEDGEDEDGSDHVLWI